VTPARHHVCSTRCSTTCRAIVAVILAATNDRNRDLQSWLDSMSGCCRVSFEQLAPNVRDKQCHRRKKMLLTWLFRQIATTVGDDSHRQNSCPLDWFISHEPRSKFGLSELSSAFKCVLLSPAPDFSASVVFAAHYRWYGGSWPGRHQSGPSTMQRLAMSRAVVAVNGDRCEWK